MGWIKCSALIFVPFLFPRHEFDEEVAEHAERQDSEERVQFCIHANEVRVHVGDDEADGLPETVVAKRRFLVLLEQNSVNGYETNNRN